MNTVLESPCAGSVLAVDDCPTMREMVRALLERRGYRVRAVGSGRAALDAAAEAFFDLVVLDAEMPGLDGMAVGRALRSDPRSHATVIAMHSSLAEADVRAGFDGYDVYVPKSAGVFRLGDQVDRLLGRRRPAGAGPAATVAVASPAAPQ
jgi:CheY-like chemotaxis protein